MARHLDPRTAFLIAFARAPLATFGAPEWRRLRTELKQFLAGAYPGRQDESLPFRGVSRETDVDDLAPHRIKALQTHLKTKLLSPVIGERDRARRRDGERAGYTGGTRTTRITDEGTIERVLGSASHLDVLVGLTDATRSGDTPRTALVVSGPLPDVFLLMARLVLWTKAATPLRLCAQCGTPFAALRADSECCSVVCTKAKWWQTPKGQKAIERVYQAGGWQRGARRSSKVSSR
jgi:hypothetical protein